MCINLKNVLVLVQKERVLNYFLHSKIIIILGARRLVSVSNIQVIKSQKFECQISQEFCGVLILDAFQFIRQK